MKLHEEEKTVHAFGLPGNVMLVKRLLCEQEQMELVHLSHDCVPSNLLEAAPFPQHTPWIYYRWPARFMAQEQAQQEAKQLELLLSLGAILGKMIISIAKAANRRQHAQVAKEEEKEKQGKDKGKDEDAERYAPKAMYGILYPARGYLEAHTDAHQGWVVSLSVGAHCDFWYESGKKKHRVRIESGDLMVFAGYRLMHGVDAVGEQVPEFWKVLQAKRVVPVQFARYCLQFRHPLQ